MKANRVALQCDEFDAVAKLAEEYRRITLTPVVDDDYPSVRRDYERAIGNLLAAMRMNGRLSTKQLTFEEFRKANVTRCLKWHPGGIESWSASDWLTAVTGELGELASLLKMRNRERDGLPGNKFSPTDKQVADELADVVTYLDLLAVALHIDLGKAAVEKFNEVSKRVGFSDRL
jgi:NTP pyrophosphatase (non-canonical NTP hydrolase)